MIQRIKKNKGFTLAEMLIALAILAVISAAAVTSCLGYAEKVRKAKVYQTASQVKDALMVCEAEYRAKGELEASVFWSDAFLQERNHPDSILYPYVGDITADCTGYTLKMKKEPDGTYRIYGFIYETDRYKVKWVRDGEITVTKKQN